MTAPYFSMPKASRLVAVTIVMMLTCAASYEPLNLLVGDLHFVRPEKWKWQPPSPNSSAKTALAVRDNDRDSVSATVVFHEGPKDAPEAYNAWKRRFTDPANTREAAPEQKIINNRAVTYFEITGPYTFAGERHNNHTLLGAVIPWGGKFVHVLLIGPTAEVRNASIDFKSMIEGAMQDIETGTIK